MHFCPREQWEAAIAAGRYEGDTLSTVGFIHCSPPSLVHLPANTLARGRTDLVLLEIDEAVLPEPPRYEPGDPADPDAPLFPHVYGPIPVPAVVAVHDFPPSADGTFALPPALDRRVDRA